MILQPQLHPYPLKDSYDSDQHAQPQMRPPDLRVVLPENRQQNRDDDRSREARLVKFADIISNLRAIAVSPPAGWSSDRRLGYLGSCRNLVDAGRGSNAQIERTFDETAKAVEQAIRTEDLDQ